MFAKLHAKLGVFWWYSLMLFCACRAADLLNAFVGLWLVPKYVDPSELGAVMPLTNFANFLALPAAAFANTFRNEVSRLSINREFGKLKTLMRSVFMATAAFLFLAIIVARFTLPLFLERIRIVEGSLGLVIIAASFVSTVAPVYSNALQALKKFKAQSILSIVGAPVRLVAMLVAMPFRALTGYFIGQAAAPAFGIVASVLSLRKELSVPAERYWTKTVVRRFAATFAIFATSGIAGGMYGLVESTIIRQRLPELDSAGYYIASRFAEIATYLYGALIFTLFPFAAELARNPPRQFRLILKTTAANLAFCALLVVLFFFVGRPAIGLLPHGEQYAGYWWSIPWMTLLAGIASISGFYMTSEIASSRFGFMKWVIPLDVGFPVLLLMVTGYGYFSPYLPDVCVEFLKAHNICTLDTVLVWATIFIFLKSVISLVIMAAATFRRDRDGHWNRRCRTME